MTKYSLVGQTCIQISEVDFTKLDPAFRRATPNMTLATMACQKILDLVPNVPKEQISVILGTHLGEIGSSLDFLKTFNETGVPRPILFQNSLHNSTLGFTTIQLGLTGPALTVSTCEHTVPSAFELVENMLLQTPFVVLCFIDSVPDEIFPHYLNSMPLLEKFQNRAYGFLFSRPGLETAHGLKIQDFQWDYFPCST